MKLLRFIKIAWKMSRTIPWVDEAEWGGEDVNMLRSFLVSSSGKKFRRILLNMVLRQNALVVSQNDTAKLQTEAGLAQGMRLTVHTVEALARDIEPVEEFTSDAIGVEHSMS